MNRRCVLRYQIKLAAIAGNYQVANEEHEDDAQHKYNRHQHIYAALFAEVRVGNAIEPGDNTQHTKHDSTEANDEDVTGESFAIKRENEGNERQQRTYVRLQ